MTAKVSVGAEDQPAPLRLSPIGFVGLRVEARANKVGGFVETWSAEALMETTRSNGKPSSVPSGGASSAAA